MVAGKGRQKNNYFETQTVMCLQCKILDTAQITFTPGISMDMVRDWFSELESTPDDKVEYKATLKRLIADFQSEPEKYAETEEKKIEELQCPQCGGPVVEWRIGECPKCGALMSDEDLEIMD